MRRLASTPASRPSVSSLAFTGMPLINGEVNNREVFGEYITMYDFRQSIEEGATVPLYYENSIPTFQPTNKSSTRTSAKNGVLRESQGHANISLQCARKMLRVTLRTSAKSETCRRLEVRIPLNAFGSNRSILSCPRWTLLLGNLTLLSTRTLGSTACYSCT